MEIVFVDLQPSVIKELHTVFFGTEDDKINFHYQDGSIFDISIKADVYVTAGNSFGVMTGGIDLEFRNRFGYGLQDSIQEEIFFYRRQQMLHIGEAITVDLPLTDKKLIYAPTMSIPKNVQNTKNAAFAFKAILEEAKKLQRKSLKSLVVACPGLCTLTGGMTPKQAAYQMRDGYTLFRDSNDSLANT